MLKYCKRLYPVALTSKMMTHKDFPNAMTCIFYLAKQPSEFIDFERLIYV